MKNKITELLTPVEKNYWEQIAANPSATLRRYVDPKGSRCFRLVDEKINPIVNIPTKIIDSMLEKGRIEIVGEKVKAK